MERETKIKCKILRIIDRLLKMCEYQQKIKDHTDDQQFIFYFRYILTNIKAQLDIGEFDQISEIFGWGWGDIFFISTNPVFYESIKKYYYSEVGVDRMIKPVDNIDQFRVLFYFLYMY